MEKKTVVVIKTENSFDITEHAYSIPKFEFDSDIKSLQMQEEMANLAASTITNTTDIKIEPIEDEIEEDQPELIQLADVVKEESYLIDEEVSIKDESDKQNPEDLETLAAAVSNSSEAKNQSTQKHPIDQTIQLPYKYIINQNLQENHSTRYFECKKCSYKTERRNLFALHMTLEKKKEEQTFHCDKCQFETTRRSLLVEHLRHQHDVSTKISQPTDVFECDFCPYTTTSSKSLELHLLQLHNNSKQQIFKCTVCPFVTSKANDYDSHKKMSHTSAAVCDLCDSFTTFYPGILSQHKNRHILSNGMLKCHLCRQVTSTIFALRHHVSFYHTNQHTFRQIEENKDVNRLDFECALCSFRSSYQVIFGRHMQKHIEDNYSVDGEEEIASSPANDDHLSIPASSTSSLKLYKCYTCDKVFREKKLLMLHVKKHWKVHFKCNLCSYQSNMEHEMSKHVQAKHNDTQKEDVIVIDE